MLVTLALAQTVMAEPAHQLDFWVGSWELTGRSRNAPGQDKWTETKAKNVIRKVHKGKVIEESFRMTGFAGQSWSVYNPNSKRWNQTWVDDSGGYITLSGNYADGKMILTQTNTPPGTSMRMVFSEIKKDSFRWDWQRSTDQGKTWETQWELQYKRAKG